jgi:hypothetical protein
MVSPTGAGVEMTPRVVIPDGQAGSSIRPVMICLDLAAILWMAPEFTPAPVVASATIAMALMLNFLKMTGLAFPKAWFGAHSRGKRDTASVLVLLHTLGKIDV